MSPDSSFELNFIYISENADNYFQFESKLNKGQQINDTIRGSSDNGMYQWTGFDITYAMAQLSLMKPSLVELVSSSAVYRTDESYPFVDQVRTLFTKQTRLARLINEYRRMSIAYYKLLVDNKRKVNIDDYLLHVIRPMIMSEWLVVKYATPHVADAKKPTLVIENDFNAVLSDLLANTHRRHFAAQSKRDLYNSIKELVEKKKTMSKNEKVARIKRVDEWIQRIESEGFFYVYSLDSLDTNNDQDTSDVFYKLLYSILEKFILEKFP